MISEHSTEALIGNRYQLLDRVGAGGMGTVYRALDRLNGEVTALKRVLIQGPGQPLPASDSDDLRLSISREFRTLASLHHPNIINVADYGFDHERQPFFTMELLDQPRTLVEAAAGASAAEKVRLLVEMLQALAYFHRRGVVHRDLKPANVLVNTRGGVKVLDFGLATRQASLEEDEPTEGTAGTIAYMAPELFMEQPPSIASDLYAAGVIACEVFAGQRPFDNLLVHALIVQILHAPPDLAGIDDRIRVVLERLLAKEPSQRISSAEAAIAALIEASGQPVPVETLEVRESFLQASTFVGRESELQRLRDALEAAAAGRGSAWLIGGESGVGKSRLLDELRTRALVSGVLVLRGQGVAEGGLPYQLWRDTLRTLALSTPLSDLEASILKPVVPDIGALLGRDVPDAPEITGKSGQQRLVQTMAEVFKRQTEPLALMVEDLQWTSESLEVLKTLSLLAPEFPWLIIGTYRDDETPDLPQKLPGVQAMKLARLSITAIADLSEAMLGEAGRLPNVLELIQRETEGNAFFMVETVRALAEEAGRLDAVGSQTLPARVFAGGIQAIVRRRLARAPARGAKLLRLAAVAGRELDLKLLHVLMDAGAALPLRSSSDLERWLIACSDAAVLEVAEQRWRFAHDKLREAVLSDLSEDDSRDINRQVALGLETVYPDVQERAAALFGHWQRAGDDEKTLHFARAAGKYALNIADFAGARHFSEAALALLPATAAAAEARADILEELSNAQDSMGDYPSASRTADDAIAQARQVNDPMRLARALTRRGTIAWEQGDFAGARRYLDDGLALARDRGDGTLIARLLTSLGIISARQGKFDEARQAIQESFQYYQANNDRHKMGVVLMNLGSVILQQGDNTAARPYYEQSLAYLREAGNRSDIGRLLANLGNLERASANYARAADYLEEARTIFRATGDRKSYGWILGTLAQLATDQHEYPKAVRLSEEGLVIFRQIQDRQSVAWCWFLLGDARKETGEYEAARTAYEEALAIRQEIEEHSSVPALYFSLGHVAALQGDLPEARRYYYESLRQGHEQQNYLPVFATILELAALEPDAARGISWAEMVRCHPTRADLTSQEDVDKVMHQRRADLTPAALAAAQEHGRSLDVNAVVEQLLLELGAG